MSEAGMAEFVVFCDDCDLNTGHVDRDEAADVRDSHREDEPRHDVHLMERLK